MEEMPPRGEIVAGKWPDIRSSGAEAPDVGQLKPGHDGVMQLVATTAHVGVMSEIHAPRLLTETELAEQLQIPPRTVRYWREQGSGPKALRMGKHTRYRPSDIEEWLDHLSDAS